MRIIQYLLLCKDIIQATNQDPLSSIQTPDPSHVELPQ